MASPPQTSHPPPQRGPPPNTTTQNANPPLPLATTSSPSSSFDTAAAISSAATTSLAPTTRSREEILHILGVQRFIRSSSSTSVMPPAMPPNLRPSRPTTRSEVGKGSDGAPGSGASSGAGSSKRHGQANGNDSHRPVKRLRAELSPLSEMLAAPESSSGSANVTATASAPAPPPPPAVVPPTTIVVAPLGSVPFEAARTLPSIEGDTPPRITQLTPTPAPGTSQGAPSPLSKAAAREQLFNAIVAANEKSTNGTNENPATVSTAISSSGNTASEGTLWQRSITSQDDLERAELARCFEILHACGRATQPDATIATTRKSIEGFLEAIFKKWTPEGWLADKAKPKIDFSTEADVVAGKICNVESHKDQETCDAAPSCTTMVHARATYTLNPGSLKVDFYTITENPPPPANSDASADRLDVHPYKLKQTINPIESPNIRWLSTDDWVATVRDELQRKVVNRLHKHNKHLAIWQARRMIQRWAKDGLPDGSIFKTAGLVRITVGQDNIEESLGFLTTDGVDVALRFMGFKASG